MKEDTETTVEKQVKKPAEHLKPWQFKKGQSGNPAGRPPGSSLKDYAKKYLAGMTDEERLEFFNGIDKIKVWEMAEGKAETKTDVTSDGKALQAVLVEFIDAKPEEENTNT